MLAGTQIASSTGGLLHLIIEGLLKVSYLNAIGKEAIIGFYGQSQVVGELAIIGESPDHRMETISNATLLQIPVPAVQKLMAENTDFAFGLIKVIGHRRRRAEDRLKNMLFNSARHRLVHLILDLAADFGVTIEGGETRLRIPLSHQEIASCIGSTRETATIALGELRSAGHIRFERRHIIFTSAERLAQVVK